MLNKPRRVHFQTMYLPKLNFNCLRIRQFIIIFKYINYDSYLWNAIMLND